MAGPRITLIKGDPPDFAFKFTLASPMTMNGAMMRMKVIGVDYQIRRMEDNELVLKEGRADGWAKSRGSLPIQLGSDFLPVLRPGLYQVEIMVHLDNEGMRRSYDAVREFEVVPNGLVGVVDAGGVEPHSPRAAGINPRQATVPSTASSDVDATTGYNLDGSSNGREEDG